MTSIFNKVILFIVILATASGCTFLDKTKNLSNECEIHHIKMKKKIVRTRYGRPSNESVRKYANRTDNPNAVVEPFMGCIRVKGRKKHFVRGYVCSECKKNHQAELHAKKQN